MRPGADTFAPEWLCHALNDNITRDSMRECSARPIDVFRQPVARPRRIVGEMAYLGVDPREYSYDISPATGAGALVEVRIMFLGPLARDKAIVARIQQKLDRAAAFWRHFSPDQQIEFRFIAVTNDHDHPHFDVTLVEGSPRTPFDTAWGIEWTWHLIAHEVGHMLGLDDEYEQLRKTFGHIVGAESEWVTSPTLKMRYFRCNLHSLMCDSKGESSTPQRYHYYLILRRRFCRATPIGSFPF